MKTVTTQTTVETQPANGEPSLGEWLRKTQGDLGYTDAELREALRSDFKANNLIEWQKRFDEMFDLWFRQAYRIPVTRQTKAERAAAHEAMVAKGLAQIAERERRIKVEAKIDLLQQIWPNGKTPAQSTAKEIAQYGETMGAYGKRVAALARKQNPRSLGKSFLTSDQLLLIFETSGNLNNPRK